MVSQSLERLKGDVFAMKYSFISSPKAIHQSLQRSDCIEKLRSDLKSGVVTEGSLREFSASLLRELEYGKRFPHELAIAAIAVALENRPTPFAEEFVMDLACLDLAELPIAIRVAREACQEILKLSGNKSQVFDVGNGGTVRSQLRMAAAPHRVAVDESDGCFVLGAS